MSGSSVTSSQIKFRGSPTVSQRVASDYGAITFGRANHNAEVFVYPQVSQKNREIWGVDDHWKLINRSPNCTRVRGRCVYCRLHRLRGQDKVSIGAEPLLSVFLSADDQTTTPGAPTSTSLSGASPQTKLSHRAKLWIGIYHLFMMDWIVILLILRGSGLARRLTATQITADIRRLLRRQAPCEMQMQQFLDQACSLFNWLEAEPQTLFEAYRTYQGAIAHASEHRLDGGEDLLQFKTVRKQLIKTVMDVYYGVYGNLRTHQYKVRRRTVRLVNCCDCTRMEKA